MSIALFPSTCAKAGRTTGATTVKQAMRMQRLGFDAAGLRTPSSAVPDSGPRRGRVPLAGTLLDRVGQRSQFTMFSPITGVPQ
jgi:hypothetical protein